MNDFGVKVIGEGAATTALTVILLAAGAYIPLIGGIALIAAGVPLCRYIIRYGIPAALTALAASLLLMFVLTGDPISGPLSALLTLLPSLAAGLLMKRNAEYKYVLLAAAAASLVGYTADIMIANAVTGSNAIMDTLNASIDSFKSMLQPYLSQVDGGPQLSDTLNEAMKQGLETFKAYFPSILIAVSAVSGYVITAVLIFFMSRLRVVKYPYTGFWQLFAPRSIVWTALITSVLAIVGDDNDIVTLALQNISLVTLMAIAAVGMSAVDFRLRKSVKSGYTRAAIYLAVLVFLYALLTIIFYILVFIGMLDINMDLRMLGKAGGKSENK